MQYAFMAEVDQDRAARLVTARLRHGLETAAEAADRLGVPYGTYSCHENGSRGFTKASAKRYARAYKVRLEWLQDGTGSPDMDPFEEVISRLPPERHPEALTYLRFLADNAKKS